MADIYIESNTNSYDTNFTKLQIINKQNQLILHVIVILFSVIILIQLLFTCYVFRISIKEICCNRIIRKSSKMTEMGELSHKIEEKDSALFKAETS